jgi:hypothetical protein
LLHFSTFSSAFPTVAGLVIIEVFPSFKICLC